MLARRGGLIFGKYAEHVLELSSERWIERFLLKTLQDIGSLRVAAKCLGNQVSLRIQECLALGRVALDATHEKPKRLLALCRIRAAKGRAEQRRWELDTRSATR